MPRLIRLRLRPGKSVPGQRTSLPSGRAGMPHLLRDDSSARRIEDPNAHCGNCRRRRQYELRPDASKRLTDNMFSSCTRKLSTRIGVSVAPPRRKLSVPMSKPNLHAVPIPVRTRSSSPPPTSARIPSRTLTVQWCVAGRRRTGPLRVRPVVCSTCSSMGCVPADGECPAAAATGRLRRCTLRCDTLNSQVTAR